MSEQTESIGKLAMALAKAQAKILGAVKDSKNPFFKSSYADLASVIESIRLPLAENELAYIQTTDVDDTGVTGVTVVTTLAHSSGEWIRGRLKMLPKDMSPQGFGSAITYARRYALAAIVGVAQVDDDGNAASQPDKRTDPRPDGWDKQDTKAVNEATKRILDAVNNGHDVVEVWNEYKDDHAFATAVFSGLPKQVKDFIRDEVKKAS
jgi:hypothetical protein